MTNPTNKYPKYVPTVSEYVEAFKKIEPKMNEKQFEMLDKHYQSRCHVTTATDLALAVGYDDYGAANLQYGKLGQMVGDAMGKDPYPGVSFLVIMVPPGKASNNQWLWVMRENVVLALEDLALVKKSSHLFFPQGSSEVEEI